MLHATADEVNAVTRYTKGRIRAAQNSVHMANNFLQASRHAHDPASSPSQGPLKYAGRTLHHLCMMRGMKPWPELEAADRVELLRPLFPADLPEDTLVKLAGSMAAHLYVCEAALRTKAVPAEMGKKPVDGFVWKDEQEIDMSWAVERADGGPAHIETPDTTIREVRADDGSIVKRVQLTGDVAGLVRYRFTSMTGERRTGFSGRLIFMYGNHRGVVCMRSTTSSKTGESRVDEAAMPDMMARVATTLVQKLKAGYGMAPPAPPAGAGASK